MQTLTTLNSYLSPFDFKKATQFLDECYGECLTFQETDSLFDMVISHSVDQHNLALLKLLKHNLFNHFTVNEMKRAIAICVIKNQQYEFIAPSILSNSSNITHYTQVMMDLLDTSVAHYIYQDSLLDFDNEYINEHYPILFQKNAVSLIDILKNNINPTDKLLKNCFIHSLCSLKGEALQYLHEHYPKDTQEIIENWQHYIINRQEYDVYDEAHLLSIAKRDLRTALTANTLSVVFELIRQSGHIKEENEEKILSYILNSLLKQKSSDESVIYEFLALTHQPKNKIVSESIFDQISHYTNNNKEQPFQNFKMFYEKTKLEQINLNDLNTQTQHKKYKI